MAGGYGFSKFPQAPAPSAEDVGMGLLQRQGQGQAMMGTPGDMGMGMMAPAALDPLAEDRALREDGAQRMGGPGQIPDGAESQSAHSDNALNIAVGEALTRQGSGYTTNPNPFKNREASARQLQQLGLSEIEAMLLIRTGGV